MGVSVLNKRPVPITQITDPSFRFWAGATAGYLDLQRRCETAGLGRKAEWRQAVEKFVSALRLFLYRCVIPYNVSCKRGDALPSVVGQDLQRLFAAYEVGTIGEDNFQSRKLELLRWSRCQLSRTTPRRLRVEER